MRTLSHELQPLLAAVEGFLELIRNRTEGDDITAHGELVARGQHRIRGMRRLIQNLLQMTTIESRQRKRQLEPVDRLDIARTALDTFAQDARQRGLYLTLHSDAPITVRGDSSELCMLLQNLISDAVKYNRPGGQIHVTLDRNGELIDSEPDVGSQFTVVLHDSRVKPDVELDRLGACVNPAPDLLHSVS